MNKLYIRKYSSFRSARLLSCRIESIQVMTALTEEGYPHLLTTTLSCLFRRFRLYRFELAGTLRGIAGRILLDFFARSATATETC